MDKRLSSAFIIKLRSTVIYRREHVSCWFHLKYDYCQSLSEDGSDLYHGVKSNILDGFKQVTNRTEISSSAVLSIELSPVLKSDTHSGTLNCSIISKNCLLSRHLLISFLIGISTIVRQIWIETDEVMALSCYLMMAYHYLVSLMILSWRTMTIKNGLIYIVQINFNLIRKIIQSFNVTK